VHSFVIDETNKNSTAGQFLIVGGLVFRPKQMVKVHDAVEKIRLKYGYRDGDSLKFQISARPAHVSIQDATAAKKAVIKKLGKYKVRMITYVILHDIAASSSEQERMKMALNTLAWGYHRLLKSDDADGMMLIDRDDQQHPHLVSLFQNGLSVERRNLVLRDRIRFFGMTANNESHLSSAVDIALGGFRFCVNTAGLDEAHSAHMTANSIFGPLSSLLWSEKRGVTRRIGGFGFHARPKSVRVQRYQEQYDELRQKLSEYSRSEAGEDTTPTPE